MKIVKEDHLFVVRYNGIPLSKFLVRVRKDQGERAIQRRYAINGWSEGPLTDQARAYYRDLDAVLYWLHKLGCEGIEQVIEAAKEKGWEVNDGSY